MTNIMNQKYAIVRIIDGDGVPVGRLLDRYLSVCIQREKKRTYAHTVKLADHLRKFLGAVLVSDVDFERADAYLLHARARFKNNSVRNLIVFARAAWKYGMAISMADSNPFAILELPKMQFAGRVIKDTVLSSFLSLLPTDICRMAKFMLYTGLRPGEAHGLEWTQIDGASLLIPGAKSKSGRPRTIHLSKSAIACLVPNKSIRVFPTSRHRMNRWFARACKTLGIGKIRVHDMRHMWATRHYQRNKNLNALLDSGGWASIQSAQPYQHVITDDLRAAMDNVDYSI